MSPTTKAEIKTGLSQSLIIATKIIVIVAFAFGAGVGWNQNTADHEVIKADLSAEKARSIRVDEKRDVEMKEIGTEMKKFNTNQVKIMTKLEVE